MANRVAVNPDYGDFGEQLSKITAATQTVHVAGNMSAAALERILTAGPSIATLEMTESNLRRTSAEALRSCRQRGIRLVVAYQWQSRKTSLQSPQALEEYITRKIQKADRIQQTRQERKREVFRKAGKKGAERRRRLALERRLERPLPARLPVQLFPVYEQLIAAVEDGRFAVLEQQAQDAADVLSLRFGLKDGVFRTLEQTTQDMGAKTGAGQRLVNWGLRRLGIS